jgi:hypothetical protein
MLTNEGILKKLTVRYKHLIRMKIIKSEALELGIFSAKAWNNTHNIINQLIPIAPKI